MCAENLNSPDRLLEQQDLPIRVAWINNTALSRVLGIKKTVTLDEMVAWFKRNGGKTPYSANFVFVKDDKIRAFWGLKYMNYQKKEADLYAFIYPSLVNLGISLEVVESLSSFGIETLETFYIHVSVASDDLATIRACERCGFYKDESMPTDVNGCLRYSLDMGEWINHISETSPH